ncbi:triphosphoribosyl-dephospho-CoA synthase [Aureimonas fodinaquatilis]|uniref:Triphosphoribosyl-dephospho-CoA synthase n=1 Tax=Aureimonas fodinaquatilis TaxID=2565783 RepID=A0A5B0DRI7_9HYPH|nr:triphosphoribosyl-dephospho-CoA synthase [Aureimonas fodinaquatilis]KAA0968615.1 triphosphoribosyl-dephospho-CoA synthase [Aureimonas fodinaquatilis]
MLAAQIQSAYIAACQSELDVLKPGNVHRFAAGHGMDVAVFTASAAASAPFVTAPGQPLGQRILGAVAATQQTVGQNSNLGILLLCAPLAMAAERADTTSLQVSLHAVLQDLTMDDATLTFQAIALAAPGGLGQVAEQDVRHPPGMSLLQAMALAAGRDRIAAQYCNDFDDVFAQGMTDLTTPDALPDVLRVYLGFAGRFHDSHIQRKFGPDIAQAIQMEFRRFHEKLVMTVDPETRHCALLAFDADLKARGINPGTSADLTVATVFAAHLLRICGKPF